MFWRDIFLQRAHVCRNLPIGILCGLCLECLSLKSICNLVLLGTLGLLFIWCLSFSLTFLLYKSWPLWKIDCEWGTIKRDFIFFSLFHLLSTLRKGVFCRLCFFLVHLLSFVALYWYCFVQVSLMTSYFTRMSSFVPALCVWLDGHWRNYGGKCLFLGSLNSGNSLWWLASSY